MGHARRAEDQAEGHGPGIIAPCSEPSVWEQSLEPREEGHEHGGADRDDALAGISIASCVGSLDLDIAVGMAPAWGVVAAQASVDGQFRGRTLAVQLLNEGQPADAIIERITVTAVDPNFNSRQYGIAAVSAPGS